MAIIKRKYKQRIDSQMGIGYHKAYKEKLYMTDEQLAVSSCTMLGEPRLRGVNFSH